jgi:uncharacterized protein YecT (DUF1311 family)
MLRFRSAGLLTAVFAAVMALAAAPAHAQTRKPSGQETKIIRDCFAQKGATEKDTQCIGLVSTRCTRKPENQAGLTQADCFRVEQEIWDTLLNETYKALQGDLDDEGQRSKLRDMQRAWIGSRDATCEFYHVKIQGSMAVPMSANCLLGETARRALFLKTMIGL